MINTKLSIDNFYKHNIEDIIISISKDDELKNNICNRLYSFTDYAMIENQIDKHAKYIEIDIAILKYIDFLFDEYLTTRIIINYLVMPTSTSIEYLVETFPVETIQPHIKNLYTKIQEHDNYYKCSDEIYATYNILKNAGINFENDIKYIFCKLLSKNIYLDVIKKIIDENFIALSNTNAVVDEQYIDIMEHMINIGIEFIDVLDNYHKYILHRCYNSMYFIKENPYITSELIYELRTHNIIIKKLSETIFNVENIIKICDENIESLNSDVCKYIFSMQIYELDEKEIYKIIDYLKMRGQKIPVTKLYSFDVSKRIDICDDHIVDLDIKIIEYDGKKLEHYTYTAMILKYLSDPTDFKINLLMGKFNMNEIEKCMDYFAYEIYSKTTPEKLLELYYKIIQNNDTCKKYIITNIFCMSHYIDANILSKLLETNITDKSENTFMNKYNIYDIYPYLYEINMPLKSIFRYHYVLMSRIYNPNYFHNKDRYKNFEKNIGNI